MIVIFSTKLSLSRILTVSLVVISDDGLLMLNVPLTPPHSQSLMYPRPVSCVPTLTPHWAVDCAELNQPPVTGILALISPITAHQNKDNITKRMNLYTLQANVKFHLSCPKKSGIQFIVQSVLFWLCWSLWNENILLYANVKSYWEQGEVDGVETRS